MESGWNVGDRAPQPPRVRSESQITASWEGDVPLVTVLCRTFQHGDFIEDAIRGFLGQQTPFPFEVIIRDDASTDGTADIVADYATRFPSIIRAVLEPVNRHRQPRPNLRDMARGAFVAQCEGDDYWIDPDKLRTQVETLQRHENAALSHHQAMVIEDGRITRIGRLPPDHRRDYTQAEVVRAKLVLTPTLMHRNIPLDKHPQLTQIVNRDMFLVAQLGEHGYAKWEPDLLPAVYRVHPGGVWSASDPIQRGIDSTRSYYWIGQYFLNRNPDVAHDFLTRGLTWYLRGCHDAGADPRELLARNDTLVKRVLRLQPRQAPPSLRQYRTEVRRIAEQRDQLQTRYNRLRNRRAVRIALQIARLARPLTTLRRRQSN